MNLTWVFPILSFLQKAFLILSKLDGQPGLTKRDFQVVVDQVRQLKGTSLTGKEKADAVAEFIQDRYGYKIAHSNWTSHLLTFLAYLWAKRKSII